MERIKRRAVINGKVVESDFMPRDRVKVKKGRTTSDRDDWEGIVTEADALFVNVDWLTEERKERRGASWMVDSLERV